MRAVRAGDLDATLRASRQLIGLDPNDAEAHYFAGLAMLERGRADDAIGNLQRATALAPHRADYWAHAARCLVRLGRHRQAEAELADLLQDLGTGDAASRVGHAARLLQRAGCGHSSRSSWM